MHPPWDKGPRREGISKYTSISLAVSSRHSDPLCHPHHGATVRLKAANSSGAKHVRPLAQFSTTATLAISLYGSNNSRQPLTMGLRDMLHIKNKHSLSRTRSASPITEGVTAALARATLEIPRIDDNLSIRTVQPTLRHATTSGSSASQHSNSAAAQSTPATSTNSGHLPPGAAVPSVPGVPAYNTTPIPGSSSNVQPLLLDRQTLVSGARLSLGRSGL